MKNKNTKKNFNTHTKRSSLSMDRRQRAKRALIKLAEMYGVGTEGVKIRIRDDSGRPGKKSKPRARTEIRTEGVFSESQGGFGFVTSEEYERGDIFIPASSCAKAIGGDVVEVYFHEYTAFDGKCRTEGRITAILGEGRQTVIGRVTSEQIYSHGKRRNVYTLQPDDGKFRRTIYIKDTSGFTEGDKLLVKLHRDTIRQNGIDASILDNFGSADSSEANYSAILAEAGIECEFTPDELQEAERLAAMPVSEEGRVRIDGIVFTIDSESAKDLDDAISIRKTKSGYTLGVHIADVSHYVKEKTPLDRLVMSRGTSVYFTDKVVPMLPPALSNGACSLNPGEDKYTLSAIIELTQNGEIISTRLEKSIIRSHVKGIYSEINQIFDGSADEEITSKYSECLPSLKIMHELYLILEKRARARGAMELESEEAYISLDDDGVPIEILKRERADAERMIEQFMLTANEGVATLMYNSEIPCVYRIHDKPPKEKLDDFIIYASNLGLDTRAIAREDATVSDFSKILNEAEEKELSQPVSYAMLRSMSKAVYSEIKRPHFGLGIDNYCHFTSPIRRLSDLATHRIIHRVIFEGKPAERYRSYSKRAAVCATEGELRAVGAERKIENLYKVIYMSGKLGEIFDARISGVASFGFFARLDNTCEGLVPISELDEMYIFDDKNLTLRSSSHVYRIGDDVKVKLEDADISSGKLRFSIIRNEELENR